MTPPPALFWMTQASKLWSASRRRSGFAQTFTAPSARELQTEFPGLRQALHFCQDFRDRRFQKDALGRPFGRARLAKIAQRYNQLRHLIGELQRLFEQGPVIRRRAFSHQPQLDAAAQCGHGLSQAMSQCREAFAAVVGIGMIG